MKKLFATMLTFVFALVAAIPAFAQTQTEPPQQSAAQILAGTASPTKLLFEDGPSCLAEAAKILTGNNGKDAAKYCLDLRKQEVTRSNNAGVNTANTEKAGADKQPSFGKLLLTEVLLGAAIRSNYDHGFGYRSYGGGGYVSPYRR